MFEALEKIKGGKAPTLFFFYFFSSSKYYLYLFPLVWVCPIDQQYFFPWFPSDQAFSSWLIFAELMVLGFISLLLTFGQTYIARICIPEDIADTMLPCPIRGGGDHHEPQVEPENGEGSHHRRLLWHERRYLAAEGRGPGCKPVSLSYREDNFKYRIWAGRFIYHSIAK